MACTAEERDSNLSAIKIIRLSRRRATKTVKIDSGLNFVSKGEKSIWSNNASLSLGLITLYIASVRAHRIKWGEREREKEKEKGERRVSKEEGNRKLRELRGLTTPNASPGRNLKSLCATSISK